MGRRRRTCSILPAGSGLLLTVPHFRRLNQRRWFFEPLVMTNDVINIERVPLEMIERFGSSAVSITRWQAEIVATVPDMLSAKMWREIANAIERH